MGIMLSCRALPLFSSLVFLVDRRRDDGLAVSVTLSFTDGGELLVPLYAVAGSRRIGV